jgi:predicted Zn-dependent protease
MQEYFKMRRNWITGTCFVLVLIIVASCSNKTVPSQAISKEGKGYDQAEFNYMFVEAVKQKLMGNSGDALKYLEQCIKINPLSDAAYYQMAQIVVSGGDIHNGKKYALKALSVEEKNIWYLMMIAGMYYQEKNLDSAQMYYEKAVKYFPDNENIQLTLGNLYSENKKFDKAAVLFDSFDKKYGVTEASTLSAVKSLIEEKKFDEALIKTQLLIEKYPDEILYKGIMADIYNDKGDKIKALELYNTLIEKYPENGQIQLSYCDFLLAEKNYSDLFLQLNKFILNNAISREDKISFIARMLEDQQLIIAEANNFMILLMVLNANYIDDNVVPLLIPELLIKQNKFSDAALKLEEIIKKSPENYYAWEKLLLVYLDLKDYSKLMIRGEECASRFNMSFLAKIVYANAAIESGKFDIAAEELRKAEIIAGSDKESIIQVLTMRGDLFYRMKDYAKAFEVFEKALEYNKNDLTVMNNYAYFLAEQNTKLKEAEEMSRKVIETEKNNTTFLDTYAWVLYKRGKLVESARIMEGIINSTEKRDAEWYEHYGYILKKQRKCSEAVKMWNISLSIDKTKTHLTEEIKNCEK